ncbi:MAG: response regulator [Candidatus Omnitrophica bacterium]|jgi:DNA-binding response OmpR family regulator|nr:response regulator [Candidatus Omnitrophota bacterium]
MAYKIMVVDDEQDVREFVGKRLISEGYDIILAADGEEAIEKASKERPDIVLLDLMMPKKDGFSVMQEIRKNFADKWIPIIIVSAKNDLEAVKKSYQMEADHYLTKPCTIDKILEGVKTMVSLMPLRVK